MNSTSLAVLSFSKTKAKNRRAQTTPGLQCYREQSCFYVLLVFFIFFSLFYFSPSFLAILSKATA